MVKAGDMNETSRTDFNGGESGIKTIHSVSFNKLCILCLHPLCCILDTSLKWDGQLHHVDGGATPDDNVRVGQQWQQWSGGR